MKTVVPGAPGFDKEKATLKLGPGFWSLGKESGREGGWQAGGGGGGRVVSGI